MSTWSEWVARDAERIRAAGQWREPRDLDAAGPEGKLAPDGRPVVSFASNDYLGLTQHAAVVAAARTALDRWGAGAGSARLIVGSRPVHTELETALADWKGEERAVLFPTGFAANLGVLTTFGGPDTLVVSDELNHASIIDGCRLSQAAVEVARHADPDHVDTILRAAEPGTRAIVVTDTVFSMDGDLAPIDALIEVCARHGALLVLDEAHAVLGPMPDLDGVDAIRIGTFIFTTASTPADAAAALAALAVVQSAEGDRLRARLRAHVARLRPGHPSPIIPVVIGDERTTLAAAASLLDEGMLVPAIRPPTVPPGTSRLRVALSAAHTDAQVDRLATALELLVSETGHTRA